MQTQIERELQPDTHVTTDKLSRLKDSMEELISRCRVQGGYKDTRREIMVLFHGQPIQIICSSADLEISMRISARLKSHASAANLGTALPWEDEAVLG